MIMSFILKLLPFRAVPHITKYFRPEDRLRQITTERMRPILPLLLPSVLGVALLEKDNPGHEKFVRSEKCPLSRLEQDILEMRVYNMSRLFLPRLTDLATHYPGERFTVSKEKVCRDENHLCERSVRSGACIGQDTKVR